MSKKFTVAVVGATGAVGEVMLEILVQRKFPVGTVYALASENSVGKKVAFGNRELTVANLADFDFSQADIGLFSAGGSISAEFAPKAAAAGCVVVDNTSNFRYDDDIPLVVPEVNEERIADYTRRGIIANPNCSTIQMVVPLFPLHRSAGIKRIIVSTYQSVSGMGRDAIDELQYEIECLGLGQHVAKDEDSAFPHAIAGNIIPQIGEFDGSGYTTEEMKMVNETRKIFSDETISVTATCVRIPVFVGHSEVVSVEFKQSISAQQACALLKDAPGVTLLDDPQAYPMPVQVKGTDAVFVGRIRQDFTFENGLTMWCVADNLRKGAALNAVQIAERLV